MQDRSTRRSARLAAGSATLALVAALRLAPATAAADTPGVAGVESEVHVNGMTFVVSREGEGDLVFEARRATLHPERNLAELHEAKVSSIEGARGRGFDVHCDRGEFDLTRNDF